MIKRLFYNFLFIFLTCFFVMNMDTKLTFASNHVHTDACYAGHRHVRSGCPSISYYTGTMPTHVNSRSSPGQYSMGQRSNLMVLFCSSCSNLIAVAHHSDYLDDGVNESIYFSQKYLDNNNNIVQKYSQKIYMWLTSTTDDGSGWTKVIVDNYVSYKKLNPLWNSYYKLFYSLGNYGSIDGNLPKWYEIGFNASYSCPFCLSYGRISKTLVKEWTCGLTQDETPICPAYTVPPTVSLNNINSSTILTESYTYFSPEIKVYDNENDNLDCRYYIDGSTTAAGAMTITGTYPAKTVTFKDPFKIAGLAEGTHTIKVTASDNFARDIGQSTVTFKVDKSAPVSNVAVTNSVSSIRLDVSASDTYSGLAASAYRYTIGSTMTDWLSANNYTMNGLTPNTAYSYKVEVRDAVGHINTVTGNTYTKSDTPVITATALPENMIKIIIKDSNPLGTNYRIKAGNGYANADGSYVSSESWFTLPYDTAEGGKVLIISGLASNTSYSISVSSRNSITGDISTGTSVSAITSPGIPGEFACSSKSYNYIQLNWGSASGAASYQYCREILQSDGATYLQEMVKSTASLTVNDNNLQANQSYRYKIRAVNSAGLYGLWSQYLSEKTYPLPPAKVMNVRAVASGSNLNITWDQVAGSIGYKIIIICDGIQETIYSTVNQYCFSTVNKYNCQCDVTIQAFNASNGEINDTSKWTNGGVVSDRISCYTSANTPIINTNVQNITPNSLKVTWQPNGNPASVKFSLGVFKNSVLVSQTNYSTSCQSDLQNLEPETFYTFKVKAINSNGTETVWSNEVSATTLIDYPGTPGGLTASSTTNSITLKWNAAVRAQSYQVKRGEVIIAELNAAELIFIDNDLTPEIGYTYSVSAVNAAGISWSQCLTQKTKQVKPAAPIVSVYGSSVSATLSWPAVEGASGYDVQADGTVYNVGHDTEYTQYGLAPGSSHNYRVRTRKDSSIGEWGQMISFRTIPDLPGIPANILINTTDKQIKVSWPSAINAVSYDVEIDGIVYSNIMALEYLYSVQEENPSGVEHKVRVRAVNSAGLGDWSEYYMAVLQSEGGGGPILGPLPAVPSVVCSVSGSAICISWNETEGASVYQLEADNTVIYTGPNNSYEHTGLAENSLHQYRVAAGNLSGFSDWSNPVTAITNAAASNTPQNITYYRENDSLTTVTWTSVNGASGYRIEVNGVLSESIINDIKTSITTVPGEQYNIRIASVILSGETELLDWSDDITFRTPAMLPVAPVIDSISAASDMVSLSWAAVTDATGYDIEADGKTTDIRNTLNYTITNLEPSTTHTVKLRAYNEAGKGDWSKAKTIMTNDSKPDVPINITGNPVENVNALSGSAIQLKWTGCDNAVSYEVEDDAGNIHKTNVNEIIIGGLLPGELYTFRVRALTETGAGEWSSRISVVPVVIEPKNVSIAAEDGTVRITWDKVGGAELYEIELDGIKVAATDGTSYDLNYDRFYMQRTVRIRACYGAQKSEWSQAVLFSQALPVTVNLVKNEEVSILLPVNNADLDNYKLTLIYNPKELVLLDAFETTPEADIQSVYKEEYKTSIIIEQSADIKSITFLLQADEDANFTGTVSSIRFRSMITGPVTLKYGVTEK